MPLVDTLVETYNKKIKKYKQKTQAQSQTQGQAATASDGKVNRETRQSKFISFSINNILIHSEKLMNDRTGKKDDRINATTVTAIATATPDVLNSSVFFSTMDPIILSNLQP